MLPWRWAIAVFGRGRGVSPSALWGRWNSLYNDCFTTAGSIFSRSTWRQLGFGVAPLSSRSWSTGGSLVDCLSVLGVLYDDYVVVGLVGTLARIPASDRSSSRLITTTVAFLASYPIAAVSVHDDFTVTSLGHVGQGKGLWIRSCGNDQRRIFSYHSSKGVLR